jgi:hypothetical protein
MGNFGINYPYLFVELLIIAVAVYLTVRLLKKKKK